MYSLMGKQSVLYFNPLGEHLQFLCRTLHLIVLFISEFPCHVATGKGTSTIIILYLIISIMYRYYSSLQKDCRLILMDMSHTMPFFHRWCGCLESF